MKFSTSPALVSGLTPPEDFPASENSQPASLFQFSQYCNLILTGLTLTLPALLNMAELSGYTGNSPLAGPGIVFSVILDDEAHTASRETKWGRFRENLQHFHNIQYRSGARKWQPATLIPASLRTRQSRKKKRKKITQKIINHRVCLNIGDPLIPLLILFTRHYFSMKLKLKTILDQSA